MSPKPTPGQIREINDSTRYAMWSVFKVTSPVSEDRAKVAAEVETLFADMSEEGVVVRGVYDVAGLRADADFMIWWHAEDIRAVQSAYHRFLRTELAGSRGAGCAIDGGDGSRWRADAWSGTAAEVCAVGA